MRFFTMYENLIFQKLPIGNFWQLRDLSFSDSSWECTLPRFSPRNKKTASEKDKNKPQKLGRFEIFFRGLIATFWHSRSHKIEVAVLGLLA